MSNTSTSNDKTVADDAKVKLIIGEIGRDTQTGIIGRGYSFDNGNTFHVTDTIYGRLYTQNDADGLWNNGLHEKVKEKVNREITNTVEPAIKQADSAVAYANDAIEKSRVNSQAIVEINSAVSDAISDAAVARSDGLRAWDAAQSNVDLIDLNYASASAAISSARTEAIAAADEAKKSASAAQADIVAVRSDVAAVQADVTATKSDVAVAKNDIVKAKSDATAGINAVKSDVAVAKSDITDTKTSLASQAKSLSSYVAQASAAGKDITTLKSQAGQFEQDMADTKGDVSQLKVSASSASAALSDAAGNISSLQASAKSYSAALSDTNSNVASVTATASELEAKYADAAGDISQIKTDAKGTAETIADAQGDIASLKKRADGFDTQFTNAKSDIAVIQSNATGTKETLANTKSDVAVLQSRADGFDAKYSDVAGDVSTLQSDAKGTAQTLADAQGDIAKLKTRADGFDTEFADANSNISKLQTDAKGTTQTLADAQGDIAKLKTRADGFDTQFSNTNGDISKLQVDASGTKQTLTNAQSDIAVLQSRADGFDTKYADVAGDINTLQVDASGMKQTLTDAQGNISTLQATATGFKNTLTDAQGNISTLQSDVAGLKKTTSDHAGNIATLQADAKTLTSQMSSAQGDISTLKQTASGFSSKVSGMETSLANANNKINGITSNGGGTNILRNTDPTKIDNMESSSTWILGSGGNGQAKVITLPNVFIAKNGFEIYGNTNGNRDFTQRPVPWDNAKYVFSVYAKIADVSDSTSVDMMTRAWSNQAGRAVFENHCTLTSKNWVRVTMNIDASSFYTQSGVSLAFGLSGIGSIDLAEPMLEKGTIAHDWSPAPEDTDAKITTNATAIEHNKKAIALKADQTVVDKTNGTVQQLQAQFKVQADQIAAKVSSSDLDAKGYATQTYTQTQIKQTADSWNANLTSVKNGLTDKYTNLHATVDGIKGTVATKADQSEVTQLSNLVQTKVSSGDFTSTTTQLKNLINQRVQVGDVISQINQEAGGDTLIQVSGGKGKFLINAGSTIFSGSAFIPVGCIANLTADHIKTGTLTGSTVHLDDGNGNTIDLGALSADYVGFHSKATNGDQTYIDLNGIHNYGSSYDTKISQGKITTNLLAVNGGGLIDFRSSGNGTTIDSRNIKFYNSNAVNGGIEFSGGSPLATVRDGTVGNELRVRYDRSFALTPIKDESARICASSAAMQVGFIQSGSSTPDLNTTGLWVDNDSRHVNLGVWGADSTWARVEANTHNIHMQADKAHAWLSSDNVFHIYKDGDGSSTATQLRVDGWAWINGWVEAAGHSQHSALSTKTDIQPVDDDKMLEMVNGTDLATFLYKTDVANGETHRHIGLIIDDVHDVAQYQTPQEFIAPNGVSRDDDNMIGALFGAVKALTKRIKTLESKVG
ncbi:tail fiber domain-containing protein [Limosilactobacillus mucosae]|uniref:tail fiber domain-containing protein n=1 Tax=Limosilactobacillus mucosae TaxID=97478 RepID=UPI0039944643